ncbi:MAG: cobalamin biosynthesis protein CobQ [Thermoprotei archaeon]|nr:MAG: cobalamin biosynthesis protein CobQ [Thermoprotei archaeon]
MTFKLAVTGGKGGTGKTVVAVNLAAALSSEFKVLLVDADVDGPSTTALLRARMRHTEEVRIFKPVIDPSTCKACGRCAEVCREHALAYAKGVTPILFEELCSGCKACLLACEYGAIREGWRVLGYIHEGEAGSIQLRVGELKPGEARSPIVARALKVKVERELNGYDVVVIDTAPGIHNAVVQALWGVDLALAVTEPTPLGLHDLRILLDLLDELKIKAWVVLNKSDIPGGLREEVVEECRRRGLELAVEIPYDQELFEAYVRGEPLIESRIETPAQRALLDLALKVEREVKP